LKYKYIDTPQLHEYAPYFKRYIYLVSNENILELLENQLNEAISLYNNLDNSKIDYRYSQDKWSVKEIILHILDTERIFTYRALRIARKDKTSLPGFEQDDYINNTNWDNYQFSSVLEECELLRKHTITFFNNMTDEMLKQSGISSNMNLAVLAIPFIIAGHERHHLNIINSRYL